MFLQKNHKKHLYSELFSQCDNKGGVKKKNPDNCFFFNSQSYKLVKLKEMHDFPI